MTTNDTINYCWIVNTLEKIRFMKLSAEGSDMTAEVKGTIETSLETISLTLLQERLKIQARVEKEIAEAENNTTP